MPKLAGVGKVKKAIALGFDERNFGKKSRFGTNSYRGIPSLKMSVSFYPIPCGDVCINNSD